MRRHTSVLIGQMKKSNGFVPEAQIISWVTQIASTFSFLSQKRVLHRDVKPENILLDSNNRVKVRAS